MTVWSLEMKLNIPNILNRSMPRIGYKTSNNVNKIANAAQELMKKGIVNTVVIECPIEAIILPGVTLHTDKEYVYVHELFFNYYLYHNSIIKNYINNSASIMLMFWTT